MDMDEMTSDNPRKFDGTFDGVGGKYACTGGTCSATANADGQFTMFEGTWTFTPDYLGPNGVADGWMRTVTIWTRILLRWLTRIF